MNRALNDIVVELITKHEGLRLKPYRCSAGKLTIGYGHNLEDRGISRHVAGLIFREDLMEAEEDAKKLVGEEVYESWSINRKAAFLDFVFNLGYAKALKFTNSLDYLQKGEFAKAADHMMDSLWAKQVGQRAKTVTDMIRNG